MSTQQRTGVREVRGGTFRVLEHAPSAAGGLRVRSMPDHSWGGTRFYLIDPDAERYATETTFLSEDGARRAAIALTSKESSDA